MKSLSNQKMIGGRRYTRYFGGNKVVIERGRRRLLALGKSVRVIKDSSGTRQLYADGRFVDLR